MVVQQTEQDLLRDIKAGLRVAVAVPSVQEKVIVSAHFALSLDEDLDAMSSLTFVLADVSPSERQLGRYDRAYVVSFDTQDPQVPKTLLNAELLVADGKNVCHIALDTITVM